MNQVQRCQLKNKTILEDAIKAAVTGKSTNTKVDKEEEAAMHQVSLKASKPMVYLKICTSVSVTAGLNSFLNWRKHSQLMPCQENKTKVAMILITKTPLGAIEDYIDTYPTGAAATDQAAIKIWEQKAKG